VGDGINRKVMSSSMRKTTLFAIGITALAAWLGASLISTAQQARPSALHAEYAVIKWDGGDKVCVNLPGKSEIHHVFELSSTRTPKKCRTRSSAWPGWPTSWPKTAGKWWRSIPGGWSSGERPPVTSGVAEPVEPEPASWVRRCAQGEFGGEHFRGADIGGYLSLHQRAQTTGDARVEAHGFAWPRGADDLDVAQGGQLESRQRRDDGSFCATTPATCAAASTSSTPGRSGSPGR